MTTIIGADHEFHDTAFVTGWANRFVPTPERLALFNVMLDELRAHIPADGLVVELGIGPGYLAAHLLQALPALRYCGVDFSRPMLDIAAARVEPYAARVSYTQTDLVNDQWWTQLPPGVDAIVSTWALHDLGSPENVEQVYINATRLLPSGGLLLNGDFIKPDGAIFEYEPGRFEIGKHLEMFGRAGYLSGECLIVLEREIEAPTSAQNYACLKAVAA